MFTFHSGRYACLVMILAIVVDRDVSLRGQSHSNHQKGTPGRLLVLVDGSVSPDAVPDDLAYRHFLLALLQAHSPESERDERRLALLSRAGLDDSDSAKAIAAVAQLHSALLQTPEVAGLSTNAQAVTELSRDRELRDGLLDDSRQKLIAALSPGGRVKLDTYVREHVKRRITIYGEAAN